MEIGPHRIGKTLVFVGIIITLSGGLIMLLGKAGLFKLPGDLEFGSRN